MRHVCQTRGFQIGVLLFQTHCQSVTDPVNGLGVDASCLVG